MHLRRYKQTPSDCLLPQEEPRFHPILWLSPFQCYNLQPTKLRRAQLTPLQVVALRKALQYPDNCFHANNRFKSKFHFVMKGVPADDGIERLAY
jgi:hypothetical protein